MVRVVCMSALAACILGCGTRSSQPPITVTQMRGEVDISLPADQQQKQRAVKQVLDEIWRGTAIADLEKNISGVRFDATRETFFGDNLGISRWSFVGPPEGDIVVVSLTFWRENDRYEREEMPELQYALRVTGGSDRFVIQLVQDLVSVVP